jgi:predicted transcriptional regulator
MADSLSHRLMIAVDACETMGNAAHDPTLTTTTLAELGKLLREVGRELISPCRQADSNDSACRCCQGRFYRAIESPSQGDGFKP